MGLKIRRSFICWEAFAKSFFGPGATASGSPEESKEKVKRYFKRTDDPVWFGLTNRRDLWVFYAKPPRVEPANHIQAPR